MTISGYRESLTGDTSHPDELQSTSQPDESLHEEMDVLRILADAKEQSSSGSLWSHLSGSWHEKWVTDESNLHDPGENGYLLNG